MLYFYSRGHETKSYQVRSGTSGEGYELIVHENGREFTERFANISALLSREHELVTAWRALGWRDAMAPGGARVSL